MWLPQLPERLHWDHNAQYHRWLLRQLPARPDRALDVGCGSGRLACILSARATDVDALDRSPVMLDHARRRCPQHSVRWIDGDLLEPGVPLARSGYDAITAVASLHHMPLRPALTRLAELLRPGGVLTVVGLYQPATARDLALELVAVPANAGVGVALALRGRAGRADDDDMPVLAPVTTLADVRAAMHELLPGATLRRGLFWRYLLTWRRPCP